MVVAWLLGVFAFLGSGWARVRVRARARSGGLESLGGSLVHVASGDDGRLCARRALNCCAAPKTRQAAKSQNEK